MKQYPRIGSRNKLKGARQCRICGSPGADERIDIQVSWFRGEDEVLLVHSECANGLDANALLDAVNEYRKQANRQTPEYQARQEQIRQLKQGVTSGG